MTEVITPAHDAYKAAHPVAADALRDDVAIGFGGRQLYVDGVVAVLTLGDHVGQVEIGVGSAHQIGVVVLYQVVLHALGHAAEDAEDGLWGCEGVGLLPFLFGGPSSLFGMERVEAMINLVFGVLANAAGVEEDGVGLLLRLAQLVAGHLHHRRHHLTVGHVHLATVCFDIEFLHIILLVV